MTSSKRRSLRNQAVYVIVALVIFFGSIGGAQALGWWATSGRVDSQGNAIQPSADPSSIKGWMTVQQVCEAFAVDVETLYRQFGIPATTPVTTELKDLEPVAPGFSITSLRDWLATLGR